jgi:hypothetical protein
MPLGSKIRHIVTRMGDKGKTRFTFSLEYTTDGDHHLTAPAERERAGCLL